MKKLYIKIFIVLFLFVGMLTISNISNASNLELRTLNYIVQLNSDGTANVTETWEITKENASTLFKTFEIDKSKYKEISDINVSEIKNGEKINFTKINQYQYHVDKNKYYALIYNNHFEIAWGVENSSSTNTYEISYKIIDAVKNYNDISEFYWQFISTDSEIPADIVTGKIILPKPVNIKEDLRAWAHGALNGNITIESKDSVIFEVVNLRSKTMLETRIIAPKEIFAENLNVVKDNKLDNILSQEEIWANEANQIREQEVKRQKEIETTLRNILIFANIIGIMLSIFIIKKIVRYNKKLKENPKLKPEIEYEYFRDIPDEVATPSEVAFLYYFGGKNGIKDPSKIIAATMLDLCIKKYIHFEIIPNKKNQVKVILDKHESSILPEDEQIIFDILKEVPKENVDSFDMKELQKYVNKNSTDVAAKIDNIEKSSKKIQIEKDNYDESIINQANRWLGKGGIFLGLGIFSIFLMQIAVIPLFIASVYCFMIGGRLYRLTQKGINESAKWTGLRKYMEDFSLIKDREVPELILWEKYLVYATMFGVADKVLKQLKVIYPQITDVNYLNSNGYAYMYLMYSTNFNSSFISTLNTSVSSTYSTLNNYSSGAGMGGGFSSGGGFGGGGGRNGR